MDWAQLRQTVHDGIRFLDDVVTVNHYPFAEIRRATEERRKVGLGVMGFAEACILREISYNSKEAISFAEELMQIISSEARRASTALAEERGTFPGSSRGRAKASGQKLRNATQLSIAPTGTISLIAGTSPGVEPLFALAYQRVRVLDGQRLVELNPVFARYLETNGRAQKIIESVEQTGSLEGVPEVPFEARRLFLTALEVPPEQHVRVQAAFQKYVDNAASKTVNLPAGASVEQIANVYALAHKLGCKGITVYRYGSKTDQVLRLGTEEEPYEREYFTRCDPDDCRL